MSLSPQDALAAASRPVPRAAATRRVLVVGGGGTLGSAVVEQLLASHRFERVGVLAGRAVQPAVRSLQPVPDEAAARAAFAPDTALIVFDRERHANGRDAAFVRPEPADLPAIAQHLFAAGVRCLVVVVPHAPALLPQALKQGLASLDEGAVAALGFEQLVFMRMAQAGDARGAADAKDGPAALHGLATWMLQQLRWMVPQSEQPVRGLTVARVAAALAVQLPATPAGTRVLPPEVLAAAAQFADPTEAVADWLAGQPVRVAASKQRW